MTIKITAQQLSMRFKERVLFHIPSLCIGPNDAIYLKGDNGVGKTTLLKILSGLVKPTTGSVHAPSDSWLHRLFPRTGRKDVIYLHQSPYLFDGTVYENVVYGIRYQKEPAKDKRAQVITALRMVRLETLADEHISVLSGGEKQRVAMEARITNFRQNEDWLGVLGLFSGPKISWSKLLPYIQFSLECDTLN